MTTETAEKAIRLVEITQRKADELFEALIEELRGQTLVSPDPIRDGAIEDDAVATTDTTGRPGGYDKPWSLSDGPIDGGWEQIGSPQDDVTYTWPDGNVDRYSRFVSYRGTGGFNGMTLALGYLNNGDVVGFVLGSGGGSKRGITYWFEADDFAKSNEKVSMIRGGGERGRGGFGPGDSLPGAYDGFKVEMLRDRVQGKWNVQAVVADADDHEAMLAHTGIQARLRRLA
jgi:hypothetical protein